MSTTRTITVCVPAGIPTDHLAAWAMRRYHRVTNTAATAAPVGFFATRGRRRDTCRLLEPARKTRVAAGGSIRVLDLAAMAEAGRRASWHRWQIWNQVVRGTRVAQPYWMYVQRTRDNKRYTLQRAVQDYLAQQRIAVMNQYNLLPNRVMGLPTAHLEAFQTSIDAYTHLGGMTAIPAHGLITPAGQLLAPTTPDRLSDIHLFIHNTQTVFSRMSPDDQLVALACH